MTPRLLRLAWPALALALAGCGAVRVQPQTELPPPLIDQIPVTIGIHYSEEFRQYTYKEERYATEYEALLGPAHVAKLNRLLEAMFERVVEIDDPVRAADVVPPVVMVLEPRFEEYAFLTPRDLVGDSFTVTIRYMLAVYNGKGERVDGYVFTGYGRQPSSGLSGTTPLILATQRAMRDAGAKIAVELPDQETVRRLIAGDQVAPVTQAAEDPGQVLGAFGTPAAAPEDAGPPPAAPAAGGPGEAPVAGAPAEEAPPAGEQAEAAPAPESPGEDTLPAAQPEAAPDRDDSRRELPGDAPPAPPEG